MYKNITNRRVVRFAFVGATSTFLDVLILNILGLVTNVYLATTVGFIVGAINGYILNSRFVFKQEKSVERFSKYFFISLIGLGLTEIIVFIVHDEMGHRLNVAKLVAICVVFAWNYSGSRFWAFK